MSRRNAVFRILVAAVAAGFAFGLFRLLMLRFEAGDIYPAYSTLRTDPLGAKAFYESLEGLPGARVQRNCQPLSRLAPQAGATLFLLGCGDSRAGFSASSGGPSPAASSRPDENRPADRIVAFVEAGGRLVVTMNPKADFWEVESTLQPLLDKFDLSLLSAPPVSTPAGRYSDDVPVSRSEFQVADSPPLPWHNRVWFDDPSPAWRVVYRHEGCPAIIERQYSRGSVVVATDSYFVSNEAMLAERRADLLAWLAGGREAIFDETHLGVLEEGNIVGLARRHNLSGLAAVLVLLAGLFVWKNAGSFLPRDESLAARLSGQSVSGRSSAAALHNLLRRSIRRRELLGVCAREWSRSAAPPGPRGRTLLTRIESLAAAAAGARGESDIIASYRAICRLVAERGAAGHVDQTPHAPAPAGAASQPNAG